MLAFLSVAIKSLLLVGSYPLEGLLLGTLLGWIQGRLFLRKEQRYARLWKFATGIGMSIGAIIMEMAIVTVPLLFASYMPDYKWLIVIQCAIPFSIIGLTCSLFQARFFLKGRIVMIYLGLAWLSSMIGGGISSPIVLYLANLDAEAGMFGPYLFVGIALAVLPTAIIYGVGTSFALFLARRTGLLRTNPPRAKAQG